MARFRRKEKIQVSSLNGDGTRTWGHRGPGEETDNMEEAQDGSQALNPINKIARALLKECSSAHSHCPARGLYRVGS